MNATSTPAERLHARARLVKLRCLPRPTDEAMTGVTIGRPAVPGGSPMVSGDGPIADEVLAWAFRRSTARQLRRLAAAAGLDSDTLRRIVDHLAETAETEVPAPPRRPPDDSDPERLARVLVAAPAGPPRLQGAPATAW